MRPGFCRADWPFSEWTLLALIEAELRPPRAKEDITRLLPAQLAYDILKKVQRITEIMGNIRNLLAKREA
ncbi:MAG: hypothetical protein HY674_22665 [Chloroflexi bacterium]|nr:hypothetical protein [Chloroflexota bacterium]